MDVGYWSPSVLSVDQVSILSGSGLRLTSELPSARHGSKRAAC